MIFPQFITENATIGIVAPAGKVDTEVIHYTEKFLGAMGYRVVLGDHVKNTFHQYAGNDHHRASDLQMMLNRTDIDAIFCARGGYGTIRIIDAIDFTHYLEHPKWIVGFSDITVLHACLQNRLGVASIHGPMPKNFAKKSADDQDIVNLFSMLKGQLPDYKIAPNKLNRNGEADGILVGGNLSLIYSLRGTAYDFDPKGKILFIEDLSEYLYHLDRMMQNLRISGFLSKLSGLVVGQFSDMKDSETPYGFSAQEIIKAAVEDYDYPVVFDFPAGHDHLNQPLVLGKRVTLTATNCHCTLAF